MTRLMPSRARDDDDHAGTLPQFGSSFEKLIDYARARGNDLEAPALKLAPAIGEVLALLSGFRPESRAAFGQRRHVFCAV